MITCYLEKENGEFLKFYSNNSSYVKISDFPLEIISHVILYYIFKPRNFAVTNVLVLLRFPECLFLPGLPECLLCETDLLVAHKLFCGKSFSLLKDLP